jgi:hypothetical protein
MVAVDEHAKVMGMTSEQIITGIREGHFIGECHQGEWFVLPYSIDKGLGPTIHDVIDSINKGIYQGKLIRGKWYVSCSSIDRRLELSSDEIVRKIRDGTYSGRIIDDQWYVLISSIATRKKPQASDFHSLRKPLLLWFSFPPGLIMLTEAMILRGHTETELVPMFIFGALFIMILSWIASMFSHTLIVNARIRSNIHSVDFDSTAWFSIMIWILIAAILGFMWNDMAIKHWQETTDLAEQLAWFIK